MKAADRPGVLSDLISRDDLAQQLSVTTDTLARWAEGVRKGGELTPEPR